MPQPANHPAATAARRVRARLALVLRWAALGAASGVLAGVACWAFLTVLDRATEARLDHPGLLWTLPAVGLLVALGYQRFGGRAAEGGGLLLDQIHEPTAWVPRRMAPLVGLGTVLSHLGGASVGREGTALQLSGSLTDGLARALGLRPEDRRILLTAALGGGFGAIFGVPWAGLVFGLEVQRVSWHATPDRPDPATIGRRVPWWVPGISRWAGRDRAPRPVLLAGFRDGTWLLRVTATLAASAVGDQVVQALGHQHEARAPLHLAVDPTLLARVAVAGVAFGLAATAFIELTDLVHAAARRCIPWVPARPAIGGGLVIAAAAVVGRSYLGLSLPLIDGALAGDHTDWRVPLLKLAFTALCIGTGFIGGEVTPLFVVGATLGSAVAPTLGLPPTVGAAVGFVAVFGAASNTPLAATVVAFELFGAGVVPPTLVACLVAVLVSGRRSIYGTQRVTSPHGPVAVRDRTR